MHASPRLFTRACGTRVPHVSCRVASSCVAERVMKVHGRSVNRISWHLDNPFTLISGSQDTTVKLWVRTRARVLRLSARATADAREACEARGSHHASLCVLPQCWCRAVCVTPSSAPRRTRAAGVRCRSRPSLRPFVTSSSTSTCRTQSAIRPFVVTRPLHAWPHCLCSRCCARFNRFNFVAAFENGSVQVWDLRKQNTPLHRIIAHSGLVMTTQWHPEQPNVLASGGRDRMVKVRQWTERARVDVVRPSTPMLAATAPVSQVWDVEAGTKPQRTLQTIEIVGRVSWRPGHPGASR